MFLTPGSNSLTLALSPSEALTLCMLMIVFQFFEELIRSLVSVVVLSFLPPGDREGEDGSKQSSTTGDQKGYRNGNLVLQHSFVPSIVDDGLVSLAPASLGGIYA